MTANDKNLVAVDLLRIGCAGMVLAAHYATGFVLPPPVAGAVPIVVGATDSVFASFGDVGWVGVELFFILSGFVISRSALGVALPVFVRRRLLRLAPTAWICASATLLVALCTGWGHWAIARWFGSISLWPLAPQIDPVYWTLGVEIVFYGVVASGLGHCGTQRRIQARTRSIGLISVVFWIAVVAG